MFCFRFSSRIGRAATAYALLFVLAACGGGGGSSSDGSNGVSTDGVDTPAVAEGLSDLKISQDNELRSVNSLTVEVQMISEQSFLSICPAPDGELIVDRFDYGDCLYRSSLDSGVKDLSVEVPNHERLVAIVWFFDAAREPLVRRWRRNPEAGYVDAVIWRIRESG